MKDWKFLFEKYALRQHNNSYEPEARKQLSRIYGNLFVDVGANAGMYCRILQSHFNRIIAFEPNPNGYTYPSNVELRPIALSDMIGESSFYLNTGTGSADTLLHDFDYNPDYDKNMIERRVYHTEKSVKVTVSTYDAQIHDEAALVKIDVEGAEFQVLNGMRNSFSEKKVHSLMVELHNNDRLGKLLSILGSYGFKMKILDKHPRVWAYLKQ